MFKKYISIVPALFLVGCSWSSAPSDFSGMYRAHVTKQLDSVHQVAEDIGIGKKYMIDGSTKF